jgi:hypothetical protein
MILQYLFAILFLAQSGQQQSTVGQPPTPATPQTGVGEAVQPQDAVSSYFILLCNDAGKARKSLDDGMEAYGKAVAATCNTTRLRRVRRDVSLLLDQYYQRRKECLETLVRRQREVLDALVGLQPQNAPSPADIERVRTDLTNAEERKRLLEDRLRAAVGQPDDEKKFNTAIDAEQGLIDTLKRTITHKDEEDIRKPKSQRDFDDAVRLQETYLKNEEAGLVELEQEVRKRRAIVDGLSSSRILVCTQQEGK